MRMKTCLLLCTTMFAATLANVQPIFDHNNDNGQNNGQNRRLGLGLNAGFESPVGGASFGLYPRGNALIGDDLLYPIIVGLGLLSFVNLVLTVLIPAVKDIFPANNRKDEQQEEEEEGRGMRAMFDLNNVDALRLVDMAQSVLTAVNGLGAQYEQ